MLVAPVQGLRPTSAEAAARSRSNLPPRLETDVLVIGGGNAALCAALTAVERGVRVLLAERAPEFFRGGNSRHTRDVRFAHGPQSGYATGRYDEDEFLADLRGVTGDDMNEELARLVIEHSRDLPSWMAAQGVAWQPPLRGTLHLSRTNVFMLGGGRAMLNAYYRTARRKGIELHFGADVHDLQIDGSGRFLGARITQGDQEATILAKAAVLASGGFEANHAWLSRYWGDAAQSFIVRGSPYNTGEVLAEALAAGCQAVADPQGFHAVAVDGRAPRFDGGIVTRLDSVPFGIVVNREGERFYDEGEDFWPKRYAIWGGLIARQSGQVAFSIIDSDALQLFLPSVFPPVAGDSVQELAAALGLPPAALAATVERYNNAVRPGRFDPSKLDESSTQGLKPPKSHWARPISRPPFYGYPLRPGVTFTYMGLAIDRDGRVRLQNGGTSENIFAAGEIMAGNILRRGYLAGFGLTIGGVFGRIAGEGAARHALA